MRNFSNFISNEYVECMAEDGNGRLWVGTKRGVNRYDPDAGRFMQYYRSANNDSSISNNNILCMLNDRRNNLWLGTLRGLNRYLPGTNNFERCVFDGLPSESTVHALADDHEENLWIGTETGLYVYNPHTKKIKRYKHTSDNIHSISHNRISALLCDSKGRIWIGFHQQGVCLYSVENDDFIRFKKEDGLNDNTIRCIKEDRVGNILVGHSTV